MSFDEATTLTPAGYGRFDWDVHESWDQGRGAYGGLVVGGAARAVAQCEADPDRVLRTLSVHLGAPLTIGSATVVAEPLRIGSGLSTWSVTISDADGALAAHALAVTGKARGPDLADVAAGWGTVERPDLPRWADVDPLPAPIPPWPVFTQHVEFRVVDGAPLSGGRAWSTGYVRFRDQDGWDTAALLAIVDAWWVTPVTALHSMHPMATLTYTAHLLVDPATLPAREPLGYEAFTSAAHEGFCSETRRLWASDGRLAVENLQTVVAIR